MIWPICTALTVVALVCVLVALPCNGHKRHSQPTIAANPYPPPRGSGYTPQGSPIDPAAVILPDEPTNVVRKGQAFVLPVGTRVVTDRKRYEA